MVRTNIILSSKALTLTLNLNLSLTITLTLSLTLILTPTLTPNLNSFYNPAPNLNPNPNLNLRVSRMRTSRLNPWDLIMEVAEEYWLLEKISTPDLMDVYMPFCDNQILPITHMNVNFICYHNQTAFKDP